MIDALRELRRRVLRYYIESKQRTATTLRASTVRRLLVIDDADDFDSIIGGLDCDQVRVCLIAGGMRATLPSESTTSDVRAVFEYWREQSGHKRAKLSPLRAQRVRSRLRDGFTVERLCAAVDGMLRSTFHKQNGHDDLELALRSIEKVEQFERRKNTTLQDIDRSGTLRVPAALACLQQESDDNGSI